MSADPFYRPDHGVYGRLADIWNQLGNPQQPQPQEPAKMVSLASLCHGSDVTISLGFPEQGSPWMRVVRPGAEWWLAFSDQAILDGLNDY